ncbi:MAG: cyclic nucleotide-binding domain-containing protein [Thermoanaerobaculia bacterium]|nr:cyclic nucleotide-binding domain-containing protein [Thermoanaerobaculia bacterium]
MSNFDRLRQFETLAHFSDEQVFLLADHFSQVSYPDDTVVLRAGDSSRDVYLVDHGDVEIRRNTPYGLYTLAKVPIGDFFGETSFIDQNVRSGDAVAVRGVSLFPLGYAELQQLLEREQRLSLALHWAFWKSLSKKLRQTNERLARFFSKSSPYQPPDLAAKPQTGEFYVGLDVKRDLFREQKLSNMEINFLASLSKEKRLAPGEVLFHEGEEGDRMYIVLEGKIMISKEITGAGEEALAFLERGDYFGEMALIDREPRSAQAKAHDNGAVVLGISREVLEGLLDIQKVSSLRLLRLLCQMIAKRLREVDEKLVGWFIFSAGSGSSLGVPG